MMTQLVSLCVFLLYCVGVSTGNWHLGIGVLNEWYTNYPVGFYLLLMFWVAIHQGEDK